MRICNNISPASLCCGLESIVTLGTFDGVHAGHRSIIHDVRKYAKKRNIQSAVITFDRHPMSVIRPEKAPKLLTTLDEKLELIKKMGVDFAYIIHFTKETAEMTAEEFVETYLVKCMGMRQFIVGYDHGFGKGRKSSTKSLTELGETFDFDVKIVEPVIVDETIVSSSAVRDLIRDGNVRKASSLLERDYSITGTVETGHGVGKKIGFPTANIEPLEKNILIPGTGVYSGSLNIDNTDYDAVISIGPRLTYNDDRHLIEAHALGFSGDIYGKTVSLGLTEKLRDLVKFNSEKELIDQIIKDIEKANNFNFANIK